MMGGIATVTEVEGWKRSRKTFLRVEFEVVPE
jgi:hypothetical protein